MNSMKLKASNKGETLSSKKTVAWIVECKYLFYNKKEKYVVYL